MVSTVYKIFTGRSIALNFVRAAAAVFNNEADLGGKGAIPKTPKSPFDQLN